MEMLEWMLIASGTLNLVLAVLLYTAENRIRRREDYRWLVLNEQLEQSWDRLHAMIDPRTLEHFRFWSAYPTRMRLAAEVKKIQAKAAAGKQPVEAAEKPAQAAPTQAGAGPVPIGQGPSLLGGAQIP